MTGTQRLAELMSRKHGLLLQFLELGNRQLDLIAGGDLGALLNLLAAKQCLLAELQELERELDPFRGQDPDARPWRSSAERSRCAALVDGCAGLLADIMRQEKQGERELRVRRDEAALRLEGAHAAAHVRGAYCTPDIERAGQLDLSSEVS